MRYNVGELICRNYMLGSLKRSVAASITQATDNKRGDCRYTLLQMSVTLGGAMGAQEKMELSATVWDIEIADHIVNSPAFRRIEGTAKSLRHLGGTAGERLEPVG